MNSILSNSPFKNQAINQPKLNFKDFAANMTPEKAKAQVEQMVAEGKITQAQLDLAKQQATNLMNMFK